MRRVISSSLRLDTAQLELIWLKYGSSRPPKCWWCDQAEQSVEHVYTKSADGGEEKDQNLLEVCAKKEISWQGRTERKGLAELLSK